MSWIFSKPTFYVGFYFKFFMTWSVKDGCKQGINLNKISLNLTPGYCYYYYYYSNN
jgi:hypothetical protein